MDVDYLKHQFSDGHVGVITKTKKRLGVRHIQVLYMFACAIIFGILRGSNGITVLALTDAGRINDTYIHVFDWNIQIQGLVLSFYVWGYALMVLPAQIIFKKFGTKYIISGVLLIDGLVCVGLPTIVNKGGWIALGNSMFLMGMTQACFGPSNLALLQKWLPPNERITFDPFVYGGINIGIMISLPFAAHMSEQALGWELVFYSQAMLTLSAAVVWTTLTSSSPRSHPAVGDKEKELISQTLACFKKKDIAIPWMDIAKTPAIWALFCAHACSNIVFMLFLSMAPSYLVHVAGFSVKKGAWYTAAPLCCSWLTYYCISPICSWIYEYGAINFFLRLTLYRKLISFIGSFGVIFGLLYVALYGCDLSGNILLIVFFGIFCSLSIHHIGYLNMYKDMSENFAGSIMTLSSVVASIVGGCIPFVTGIIVNPDQTNSTSWSIVFYLVSSICILCTFIFLIFGNSERQHWDIIGRKKFGYYHDYNHLELEDLRNKIGQNNNRDEFI